MPALPPPPNEALTKRQIQEFITEHYGFAPESFTARAVDLANDVIYNTMDQVEKVVHERLGSDDSVELVRRRCRICLCMSFLYAANRVCIG
jgi:hypothetical protein